MGTNEPLAICTDMSEADRRWCAMFPARWRRLTESMLLREDQLGPGQKITATNVRLHAISGVSQ